MFYDDDEDRCGDSVLVRVLEAVLVAGLTALATGAIEMWLEHKRKKSRRKRTKAKSWSARYSPATRRK